MDKATPENKLRPEYKQELEDLERKMLEAQKFAEKFPAFSEKILANKFTGNFTGNISDTYKGLFFGWGIKRWFYEDRENIINYRGYFSPQYLWNIYINQYSLFGDHYTDTGIYDLGQSIDLFFFDVCNTTFYATDEQLIPLLDGLSVWYKKANDENEKYLKEKKKRDLMKQLEELS